nr:unnamed protein product [Callosobruchus chinensis]
MSILDAVQRRSIRLIGHPALTCHLQPLSHRRAVADLKLFYRYSNGFCSSELAFIIPSLSKPARCTRGTSSCHPKAVVLHTSRTDRYDRTFVPRCTRGTSSHPRAVALHTSRTKRYDRTFVSRVSTAWNGLPGDVLVEPASVGLFKPRFNKLPLTQPSLSSRGTLVYRLCLHGLLSYKKKEGNGSSHGARLGE